MADLLPYLLTFIIGVGASFMGALVGGGGLITIPLLIALGLPPINAIATDRLAALGIMLGAYPQYRKSNHIDWALGWQLFAIAIVGSALGAFILIALPKELLQPIIGLLMLLFLPIIFLKSEIGLVRKVPSPLRKAAGYISWFFMTIFGGSFGGGTGAIALYIGIFFFRLTMLQTLATRVIPFLGMILVSLAIFLYNGFVHFDFGIILLLGSIFGAYLGAHTALRKGNQWLKLVFAIVVVLLAAKLLISSL
ncbi:hypothetical protein COV82_05795 [Candidatus Peregrinibacteria bacterium CG11_big_fil_rev_8_21_14_0_20_46_8]|nr:MAG: hypothetical protein COV82_05795 [Candidatus Peregrinibacteria bacterium CG11_big_fil_rev_8_21_14_0_20_46_8]